MEVVHSSAVGRLLLPVWYLLLRCYESSGLARLFRGAAGVWKTLWHSSALVGWASREGTLARAWKGSAACRLLCVLINLPMALLWQLLYCGPFVRLVFRALMRVYSRAAGKAEVCELSQ